MMDLKTDFLSLPCKPRCKNDISDSSYLVDAYPVSVSTIESALLLIWEIFDEPYAKYNSTRPVGLGLLSLD